jgi:putative ABC transport system substrate-binding protein
MDRRSIVALAAAALAAPHALLAQPAKRVYRIATLDDAVESARAEYWKLFRNRLRELGLVEGKNVIYEARYARGESERLPALVAELVALKPDIIVTAGTPASGAAMKATSSIPIVFLSVGDPIGTGLVASLARPGGNATGTSILTTEIVGKPLELLLEFSREARRIAYLTDASNKAALLAFRQVEEHARTRRLSIQLFDGRERAELERSFAAIKRADLQGLIVGTTALLLEHRDQIVRFAAQQKLPVVYGRREYVDAGGLVSYSADLRFPYLRGAEYVHRILNGAKAAEIPVEQSSHVRMVLNLKTARALGITVPVSVRVRADEVIE